MTNPASENTYWNNKGKWQAYADQLARLIPAEGSVPLQYTKNKKLERYRKVANAYYDLYNNGGYNRAKAISKYFGPPTSMWAPNDSRYQDRYLRPEYLDRAEAMMDAVVIAAAWEQGVV